MKEVVFDSSFKTPYGLEFVLKQKEFLKTLCNYDKHVAMCHVQNVGCVITNPEGCVIDDEFDLDEIYKEIERGDCSVRMNKYWCFNYGDGRIEEVMFTKEEFDKLKSKENAIFETYDEAYKFSRGEES